jgi:hypothetical protein
LPVGREKSRDDLLGEMVLERRLGLARWVLDQRQHQQGLMVYSLRAPEVDRIGMGKAYRTWEVRRQVVSCHRDAKGR